jgi:hypothetical protein
VRRLRFDASSISSRSVSHIGCGFIPPGFGRFRLAFSGEFSHELKHAGSVL